MHGLCPPLYTTGGALRLLHASVAAAWSALTDTNAGGLHLQHETLEYNIHLKQMKHLGYTLVIYVGTHMQHPDKTIAT
jgi:hypothetical protein